MNQENVALGVKVLRFSRPPHTTVEYVYWSALPTCEVGEDGAPLLAPRCKGPDPAGLGLGSCMQIFPREQ